MINMPVPLLIELLQKAMGSFFLRDIEDTGMWLHFHFLWIWGGMTALDFAGRIA